MKQQFGLLVAALLLTGLGLEQANAQAISVGPPADAPRVAAYPAMPPEAAVPPHEVITIVRSVGLSPVGAPVRRGPVYVLLAANRRQEVVRVTVDASTGDVIRIAGAAYDPVSSPRPGTAFGSRLPSMRGARAYLDGGVPPVPPRSVPTRRTAAAPAAGLEPSAPPLPRPRPQVAASNTAAAGPQAAAPVPRVTGSIEAPVPVAPATDTAPPAAAAPQTAKPELHFAPVVPLD